MMEMASMCNNVFDMVKVFELLILSDINIKRARYPDMSEMLKQEQSQLYVIGLQTATPADRGHNGEETD